MSELIQFLSDLRSLGVMLSLDGERLRCSAPRGVMTEEMRSRLTEGREEILAFLRSSASRDRFFSKVDEDLELPLSRSQRRLWFIDQLDTGNPAYHIAIGVKLQGKLQQEVLEQSLFMILDRHESLRTVFRDKEGEPFAQVVSTSNWKCGFVDLSHFAPAEAEAASLRLAVEAGRRPFALTEAPLFRAVLYRISSDCHLLFIVIHHIAADGWSLTILAKELGVLYGALAAGTQPRLPPLSMQYRDYVRWEVGAGEQVALEHLPFWLENLGGPLPVFALAGERRRPEVQSYKGALSSFVIEGQLGKQIRCFCQTNNFTPFMFLLAALNVLLFRYTGQSDILIATATANRQRRDFESLLGLFVNNLVLRSCLAGNPTFREFLEQVKETALTAYAHQDTPFDLLVERLQPARDLSRNPIAQVGFAFQNLPAEPLVQHGLSFEFQTIDLGIARMDLAMEVWPEKDTYHCHFEYSTDLFEKSFITAFQRHYVNILRHVVADPSQRIGDISILTDRERRQLLIDWNDTTSQYPVLTVHRLFEEVAAEKPDVVALISDGVETSYGDLNRIADAIASRLRVLPLPAHSFIAVCAPGSPLGIAAFLGVLKAGHAYCPVSAGDPPERLSQLLAGAEISVVLTTTKFRDQLLLLGRRIQLLEEIIAGPVAPLSPAEVTIDDPAYLMYTSGSTGKPKGVVVPHRGIVRLVRGVDYAHLGPDEIFLQASALVFDASTLEIWGALLNGSRLVLLESEHHTPEEISEAIQAHKVTTLLLTAPLFHHMVAEHRQELVPLRQLLIGGDVLSPSQVARLLAEAPHLRLVNCYGPTENTTNTTCQMVTGEWTPGRTVAIGRPINNTRVFVLDSQQQPVPIGVAGELYVAGDGLALGYLNASEETARKFVSLHFEEMGMVRAYRTGDLACYRSDGALEFLGRIDHQIKLNGYRVEPAEVEEAILALPSVGAAVVAPRQWADGDRRLVAFVVEAPGHGIDPHDLRRELRRQLPRHLMPAAFVPIPEVPRTTNGKVDYEMLDALPLPPDPKREAQRTPPNGTEQKLLGLYAELLRTEELSVHDDFFSLGGHSLLAMQLLSRVTSIFQVKLSVVDVFQNPTVESLAKRVDTAGGIPVDTPDPIRLNGISVSREHPLSASQRRLWFLAQLDPENTAYNIAFALSMRGVLDPDAMEQSLKSLVERHESLRTHFLERDGIPIARVEDGSGWAMEFVDLSSGSDESRDDAVRKVVRDASGRPFQLHQGSLFRALLLKKAADDHVLVLAVHHIISDGWSLGVLGQEFLQSYQSLVRGTPSTLKPPRVQFREFVRWEQEHLEQSFASDLEYWKKQLSGELPFLQLLTDFPRPLTQSFRGGRTAVTIPRELVEQLRRICSREKSTLFMVLFAAFNVLLRQYSRQEDILVGTPTAGRSRKEFEGVVGFFATNLVLRTELGGNPTFSEMLKRVQKTTLDAFEHQSIPFDQLVEILQPERRLDRSPIFQVMFNLQNMPLPPMKLEDLLITPVESDGWAARYDLAVDLYPLEEDFRCYFEYSTDLFQESTIRRMQQRYVRLLESVAASPQLSLRELSLVDQMERRQLVEGWNQTSLTLPAYPTVQSWFRAQAKQTPAAPAIVMGDRSISYAELDARSDSLAARLGACGAASNNVVAIYLDRSPELVIALLGVLKSRAAYLPIDPALPPHRIEFLLKDACVSLILTERDLQGRLPESDAAELLIDDPEDTGVSSAGDEGRGDDLAYLIYTSGSTGRPKGTEIPQSALVNLLGAILREPGLTGRDTFVAITTISFDIAGLEIFGPLVCGAKLVVATREQVVDPQAMADLLDSSDATVLQATPSSWRMLVESGWMGKADLRMWCGGEALTSDLAESLLARGNELWNLYGPTETTIWSAAHRVVRAENPILIGRPIANTRMYILDPDGQPVPAGVPGELYIAGDGVARGYWLQPAMTQACFMRDPFDLAGTRRMYRTGDLACYRQGGQIQLLGRTDHQIKLRGHRIEPGEIESVLQSHPNVLQAIILAHGDADAMQLVAYVRCRTDLPDTDALRSWLQGRLPEYMVPSIFIGLSELPLTPNGKVDRKRLPAPQITGRESKPNIILPRNQTEQKLTTLWGSLLNIDRPGIRDNFFDLGGHSLLLVQMHARIKRDFQSDIAVIDLFRYPTIEALASFLESRTRDAAQPVGADAA